jgi:glycosyltransferase involved in cell wall biosynthesis
MKSFAYLGTSKEGGTYRVFETLRDGLAKSGWEGHFVNEQSLPEGGGEKDEAVVLEALRDHLGTFDAVIGNVFISVRLMNVLRFLPAETPRIMVVHNITRATYLAAQALKGHVHHTVAVSPRIRNDLIERFRFDERDITTIFNAVPDALFQRPMSTDHSQRVRILSLGRIEENSKRVFLIPEILRNIDPQLYHLTVAGDGPDRDEFIERLQAASIPFEAPGLISREKLPEIYSEHEIFLFPSRFEGMGLAAAEAMASGLVPVATVISGVTTDFVEHGKSGFLFPQGDAKMAENQVRQLIENPSLLLEMRQAAHAKARSIFSEKLMFSAYKTILETACAKPPIIPRKISRWRPPFAMGPGLRGLIPSGLRRRIAELLIYKNIGRLPHVSTNDQQYKSPAPAKKKTNNIND